MCKRDRFAKVCSTEYKSTAILLYYRYRNRGYFFKNGTEVSVPQYFFKKAFGIFSFFVITYPLKIKQFLSHFGVEVINF